MRLSHVRIGERFVFANIGGVYVKKSVDRAKCIYGKAKGKVMLLNTEESVYAIYDNHDEREFAGNGGTREMRQKLPETASQDEKTVQSSPVSVAEPKGVQSHSGELYGDLDEGVTLTVMHDDRYLVVVKGVSAALVAGYSNAEMVRVEGKVRRVREICVDHDARNVVVEVGEEEGEA